MIPNMQLRKTPGCAPKLQPVRRVQGTTKNRPPDKAAGCPFYLAVLIGRPFRFSFAISVSISTGVAVYPVLLSDATSFANARREGPGGPCSLACSFPRARRAHIFASGSRGHTSTVARCSSRKRRRRRQDIVLSASASIHQVLFRSKAELVSASRRQSIVAEPFLGASRHRPLSITARRRAPVGRLSWPALAPARPPKSGTRCRPPTSDA